MHNENNNTQPVLSSIPNYAPSYTPSIPNVATNNNPLSNMPTITTPTLYSSNMITIPPSRTQQPPQMRSSLNIPQQNTYYEYSSSHPHDALQPGSIAPTGHPTGLPISSNGRTPSFSLNSAILSPLAPDFSAGSGMNAKEMEQYHIQQNINNNNNNNQSLNQTNESSSNTSQSIRVTKRTTIKKLAKLPQNKIANNNDKNNEDQEQEENTDEEEEEEEDVKFEENTDDKNKLFTSSESAPNEEAPSNPFSKLFKQNSKFTDQLRAKKKIIITLRHYKQ